MKTLEIPKENLLQEIEDLKKQLALAKEELRDKERNIAQNEQFYVSLLDAMPALIWKSNPQGDLEYYNKTWLSFSGRNLEEELEYNWKDKIHLEDFERCWQEFFTANQKRREFEVEFRMKRCDGEYRWLKGYGKPFVDQNGVFQGFVGTCYEISQRKDREEQLKASEEIYRQLITFLPDAVFVTDHEKIIFVNQASAKLLGYEIEELIHKPIKEIIQPDYHQMVLEMFEQVYKTRKNTPLVEEIFIKSDGTTLPVETTTTWIRYGNETNFLTAIRDISDRNRVRELKKDMDESNKLLNEIMEYDRLKTEFLANISHEFRTPLNVMLGVIQLLELYVTKDIQLGDKIAKRVKLLKQNCYRLLRLVNNLIDITKFDCGFLNLEVDNHNVVNIVEMIVLSVSDFAKNMGLNLTLQTEMVEKWIAIDPNSIERVLLNLLSNAIKFTDSGGNIDVSIYEKGDKIYISVKDDGIGIPEDKLDTIFERFKQVDKSLTRRHEGSGIGLSLVKSIVEMHKGKVNAKSRLGHGSEFIVELPIDVIDKQEETIKAPVVLDNRVERISIEFSDIYF